MDAPGPPCRTTTVGPSSPTQRANSATPAPRTVPARSRGAAVPALAVGFLAPSEDDRERDDLGAAPHPHLDGVAGVEAHQRVLEVLEVRDGVRPHPHEHVAGADAGGLGRAPRADALEEHAAGL